MYVFRINESDSQGSEESEKHLGHGIYIGTVYLTCALLTSIIIAQIHFGTIYPFF
jgi:hypothetical protein